jgi:hypothetical protein
MIGESDEEYKQRLMNCEYENVDLITEQEVKNHTNQTFKKNLHKVLTLPLYLEERLVNTLSPDLLFSLNEKWAMVEKKFIDTYGKFPLLGEKNMGSLELFFMNVLSKEPKEPELQNVSTLQKPVPVRPAGPPPPPISTPVTQAPSPLKALKRKLIVRQARTPYQTPYQPTSFSNKSLYPNKQSLVDYIRDNGGRGSMANNREELEAIAASLF